MALTGECASPVSCGRNRQPNGWCRGDQFELERTFALSADSRLVKVYYICMYHRPSQKSELPPHMNDQKVEAGATFKPLYAQIKALLIRRIASGAWKPGMMVPNEFQLAAEYNVSQGTMRKALIALESAGLIVRRQGHGTCVAQHTRERSLFHFFHIVGLDDHRCEPWSHALTQEIINAPPAIAQRLGIENEAELHVIRRVRMLDNVSAIAEQIFVPVSRMPDLKIDLGPPMIDEMYVIYQERYGTTIAHASERIAAVAATADDANLLGIAENTPLLEITRVAKDVSDVPVELRISRCRTDAYRYMVELN